MDRPEIHDFHQDDPNASIFGTVSETAERRLSITEVRKKEGAYRVYIKYECIGKQEPRGHYVTFITHRSFTRRHEDAYELFSELRHGVATNYILATSSFTIAAIGDGGDTALTINIAQSPLRPKGFD